MYQEALRKSGFTSELAYTIITRKTKSEDVRFYGLILRFPKVLKFLNLIKRHFPKRKKNYIKSLTKTPLKGVIVV